MILDKLVEVKVHYTNKERYEKHKGRPLKNGEKISVNQLVVPVSSRIKVSCSCDICGEEFVRKRTDIRSEKTYCSQECFKADFLESNPNPSVEKIRVSCSVCEKSFEVFPSVYKKQNHFLCDRECYAEHRSEVYVKEKVHNFQGLKTNCATCDIEIETSEWYLNNNRNQFCTQECYWEHRSVHFRELYYNEALNNHRKETLPEKMIREWLESENIKFKQEAGFLRKYFVDFFIPESRTIIEAYGDYWHVNPEVYDVFEDDSAKTPLNDYQRDWVDSEYDKKRTKELESYNFKVIEIWEKDIYANLDAIMSSVIQSVK